MTTGILNFSMAYLTLMSYTEITKQFTNNFLFTLCSHNINLSSPTYVHTIRAYAAVILKCTNKAHFNDIVNFNVKYRNN